LGIVVNFNLLKKGEKFLAVIEGKTSLTNIPKKTVDIPFMF